MNSLRLIARLLLICSVLPGVVGCGMTAPQRNAGYADLDRLSWRDVDSTMTLSIGPTLLRFAASMVEDDPQTQELLRSLDGVRVRIYEIEGDALSVASDLTDMSTQLQQQGWEPAIRVLEKSSTTHVLVKQDCDQIAGLTVLTSDGYEAVVVNIMGNLRPEMFARTMHALHVPAAEIDLSGTDTGTGTATET